MPELIKGYNKKIADMRPEDYDPESTENTWNECFDKFIKEYEASDHDMIVVVNQIPSFFFKINIPDIQKRNQVLINYKDKADKPYHELYKVEFNPLKRDIHRLIFCLTPYKDFDPQFLICENIDGPISDVVDLAIRNSFYKK